MSEETYEQKYKREAAEARAKAKKAFETYKADKTKKAKVTVIKADKERGTEGFTDYEYLDWVKETETERRTKTTSFRVFASRDGIYHHTSTSKSQKFLVVSGPLKGTRQTDEDDNYVLFNRNSSWRGGKDSKVPKCVLVHVGSLKA